MSVPDSDIAAAVDQAAPTVTQESSFGQASVHRAASSADTGSTDAGQQRWQAQNPCHTWLHAVEIPIRLLTVPNSIDSAETPSRQMERKLKGVEALPGPQAAQVLDGRSEAD